MEHRGHQARTYIAEEEPVSCPDSERPHTPLKPDGLLQDGGNVMARSAQGQEVRCVSLQMNFILSAYSVPLIRTLVRRIADAWGFDALLIDDAELVASELSTNVVVHGGSAACVCFEVRLSPCPLGLRIEVSDRSLGLPRLEQPKSTAESGRGLFLVEAVCRSWGVREADTGKVVWAEVGAGAA